MTRSKLEGGNIILICDASALAVEWWPTIKLFLNLSDPIAGSVWCSCIMQFGQLCIYLAWLLAIAAGGSLIDQRPCNDVPQLPSNRRLCWASIWRLRSIRNLAVACIVASWIDVLTGMQLWQDNWSETFNPLFFYLFKRHLHIKNDGVIDFLFNSNSRYKCSKCSLMTKLFWKYRRS